MSMPSGKTWTRELRMWLDDLTAKVASYELAEAEHRGPVAMSWVEKVIAEKTGLPLPVDSALRAGFRLLDRQGGLRVH